MLRVDRRAAHADHVVPGNNEHAAPLADPASSCAAHCSPDAKGPSTDPATFPHQPADTAAAAYQPVNQAAHRTAAPTYARTAVAHGSTHVHPGAARATAGRLQRR